MTPAPKPVPPVYDPDFIAWIRTLPCVACLQEARQTFGCEAAHVRVRKHGDQANVVPLCSLPWTAAHHREQHTLGLKSFMIKYRIDLYAKARELWHYYRTFVRPMEQSA
jgi:hypothetical protein